MNSDLGSFVPRCLAWVLYTSFSFLSLDYLKPYISLIKTIKSTDMRSGVDEIPCFDPQVAHVLSSQYENIPRQLHRIEMTSRLPVQTTSFHDALLESFINFFLLNVPRINKDK